MAFADFDRDKLRAFMDAAGGDDGKTGTSGARKPGTGDTMFALDADTATAPSGASIFEGGMPDMFDPFRPEAREEWKDIFGSNFNDWYGRYKQVQPLLPFWAESQLFDLSNRIGGIDTGLTGMEGEAAGGVRDLLAPQPPGGNAFAQMLEALTPARERMEDRSRRTTEEGLARAGMLRSGAGQQLLSDQSAQQAESWASALAPMAMEGERMGLQSQMFGLPMLAGLGATEYGRQYDPMNQLLATMGALSGTQRAPERQSTGTWDIIGNLASGILGASTIRW